MAGQGRGDRGTADREHDVVLLGATGFTGRQVAAHLARTAAAGTRLALAGRSRARLEELRRDLVATVGERAAGLALLEADVDDAPSVHALAASTRVLATTVGPYVSVGEAAVAACAAAGTAYADITGEAAFVDRTWLRHSATAERTGARLVHACGFDSVPFDLGVQRLVEAAEVDAPLRVRGYVRGSGSLSGGTWATVLAAASSLRDARELHAERRRRESAPAGRRVRALRGVPGHDADAGGWVVPLPTLDPQVVTASARALPGYGPDFSYGHYALAGSPLTAGAMVAGGALLLGAAQVPPLRAALGRLRPPGTGPEESRRARGWFRVSFVGRSPGREPVRVEVRGPEPGYDATAVMLGQTALCLAEDDLPDAAGQVTTAVACGAALRERLQRNGITFTVLPPSRG